MGRKRKGKGKSTKIAKKGAIAANEEAYQNCPHSFVFQRGNVGKNIGTLVKDMRRVMQPYTASSLKVRSSNSLTDFVNVAGPLNISHFIILTKTKLGNYMRILRLPRGPTLTFKINNYSLCKDVISSIKRHNMEMKQFQSHPLLVMNGFSEEGMQFKLMTTMFQNLFPSINVNKVKLSSIRRCVLLNYNAETKMIEFRQFNIKAVPVGMSRGVKKLIKARIPDMSRYDDVSELLLRDGDLSESEAELDGPHNEVILPQDLASRGNMKSAKSAIRLTEIGPRLTLELIKMEEGVCNGEVIFHSLVSKTEEEIQLLQQKRHKKKKLKETRKQEQDENIRKKKVKKDQLKKKCLDGMKKKDEADYEEVEESFKPKAKKKERDIMAESSDDDEAYYRKEVGLDPEPEMFLGKKRKLASNSKIPAKRRKDNDGADGTMRKKSTDKGKKDKKQLTQMDKIMRRNKRKQKKIVKRTKASMKAGRGRKR